MLQHAMMRLAVAGALAAGCAAEAPAGSQPGVLLSERELAQLTSVPVSTLPAHTGTVFDCKMRAYAYEYAQTLQKWRGPAKMKEVFDSLELATLCHQEFDGRLFDAAPRARLHELPSDAVTAFVDPRASGDTQLRSALNDAGAPFGTVHEAVASIRAQRAASAPDQRAFVVLREGTHHLSRTLELGPEDSRLSFVNYPGEVTSMSGAKPITTDWKPHRVGEAGADIFVADMSQQSIRSIPGLRVDGKRGVRASYPNRDPELSIFPDGWVTDKTMWTPPIPPVKNESFVTLASPMLHDKTMFQQYVSAAVLFWLLSGVSRHRRTDGRCGRPLRALHAARLLLVQRAPERRRRLCLSRPLRPDLPEAQGLEEPEGRHRQCLAPEPLGQLDVRRNAAAREPCVACAHSTGWLCTLSLC
eukprot:COSAG04_NODE_4033_length_2352_cov_2.589880_1_plen_415_part_00